MRKHITAYVAHLHSRPAHHRRRFSMQAAAIITIAVFFIWLTTLGVRFAASSDIPAANTGNAAATLLAGDAAARPQQ